MSATFSLLRTPLLLVLLCLVLGRAVTTGLGHGADMAILSALALREGQSPDALIAIVRLVSMLGDGEVRWFIILAAAGWLFWKQDRRAALVMAIAPSLANLTSSGLKDLFERTRPELTPHLDHAASMAYPSGHATFAAALFLLAGWLLARQSGQKAWLWAGMVLALAIGIARPMLGVHWPSDVVGGWLLGAAFALAGARLVSAPRS